jgi:ornithine cyclodeaminase/alanine dehydrogenase-like protein (mu-crystallin family)
MALLISERDAREVMARPESTRELVDRMEAAFAAEADGAFGTPTRVVADHPPGSVGERAGRSLRVLPCVAPVFGGAALRVYSTLKDGDPFRPAPCELLLLFDPATMELRSLVEDYSLHALRTGAPTGVATRHLARADAEVLGVVGTGRQARGQVAAVASVRAIREVRAYGRDPGRRAAFCREIEELLGCVAVGVERAEDAVRGADVVVAATNTDSPVVRGEWLEPGAHVNSIGPSELDEAAALRGRLVPCSSREVLEGIPAWKPFPDLVARGALAREALSTELGDVVAGRTRGRTSDDEITIFLSTGMPFWDLVTAAWVDERARELGLGRPLGDARPDGYLAPRVSPLRA